jgi:Family of unknown function (DUF6029)
MKFKIATFIILISYFSVAQQKSSFFGGFESNGQWYLNDKGLKDEFNNPTVRDTTSLRSNNYLFVNYKNQNWSAGIQGESYQNAALLNLNPKYRKTDVATYFVNYKNDKIDLTAGYFYEQFGSGLLYRSWEDRALGINNALRGGRIIFKPTNYLTFKSIYGKQRTGFDVANSTIYGSDLEIGLSEILKFKKTELSLGMTYVGRDEKTGFENPNFKALTNSFSGRLSVSRNSYYVSTEYNYKAKDAIVQAAGQVDNRFIKPGSALLINSGFSKKGFGIDATFRRMENMSFFSERSAKGNTFNDRVMNFIPSLTKQQHLNLANIYVYQAQPNVFLEDESKVKAGEIGGQIDIFYDVKKETFFGGKNGMKVALNISNWNALGGKFYLNNPQNYETDFFGFGKQYYSDYNVEVSKKIDAKLQFIFSYINQYYNRKLIEDASGEVNTSIVGVEATYKFSPKKSIRLVGEHLWADYDKKNWAGLTSELNLNSKISFYVSDLYNYGNDLTFYRNHYYNIGGAYRKSSSRIALNYGRQRGGLVCVGGVCRNVPTSSGLSLSLNTSF